MKRRDISEKKSHSNFHVFLSFFITFPKTVYGKSFTATPIQLDGQVASDEIIKIKKDNQNHNLKISLTNFNSYPIQLKVTSVTPVMDEKGTWRYQEGITNDLGQETTVSLPEETTQDITLPLELAKDKRAGDLYGAYVFATPEESVFIPYLIEETTKTKQKNLALSDFEGKVVADKPGIFFHLVNPNPNLVDEKVIEVNVSHKYFFGFKTETWHTSYQDLSFLPEGKLPISLHQKGKPLTRGTYQVTVTHQGDSKNTIKKDFHLTAKEARSINKKAKDTIYDWTIPLILIVVSLVILLLVVLWLAVKQNKKIKNKKTNLRGK